MGKITVFVKGADEAPNNPRPTNPLYDGTRPTPLYAVVCKAFARRPAWCPALPLATHAPRDWANLHLSPSLSRNRGAHHRGQVLTFGVSIFFRLTLSILLMDPPIVQAIR